MKRTIRSIKRSGARTGRAIAKDINYGKKFFKAGLARGIGYTVGVLGVKKIATMIK